MHHIVIVSLGMAAVVACAPVQRDLQLVPTERSAVELRGMQSRVFDGNRDAIYRASIATMHDLGYRILRAEPAAGTVTAAKLNQLRMTVVVQPRSATNAVVRANAAVTMPGPVLRQVDDPVFYQQNFFAPLAAMLGTEAFALPADIQAVDPPPIPTDSPVPPRPGDPVAGRPSGAAAAPSSRLGGPAP